MIHKGLFIFFLSFLMSIPNTALAAKKAQGVFTVVKGKVMVIRKGKTKKRKVKVGTKVFAKDTIISNKDSRAKIVMVDKNILNISPESKLEIEQYEFNPKSNEKKVMLKLMYGKVRSTVKQKYDGEKNVYRVKTPSAVAGVRGTDFLVNFDSASQQSQIVTFEGQVQVASGLNAAGNLSNPVAVNPGQTTSSKPGQAPVAPVRVPKTQLADMQQDSNADVAGDSKSPAADTRQPANSSDNEPKAEEQPKSSKEPQDSAQKGPAKADQNVAGPGDGSAIEADGPKESSSPKAGDKPGPVAGLNPESGGGSEGANPARQPSSSGSDGGFDFMPPSEDLIGGNPEDFSSDMGPDMGDFDGSAPVGSHNPAHTRNPAEFDPNITDLINTTTLNVIINEQ